MSARRIVQPRDQHVGAHGPSPDQASDGAPSTPRMTGARAGILVFAGIALGNATTTVFHLVSARWLGPTGYADLVVLLVILGLVSFPLAGVQYSLARSVARAHALGRGGDVRATYRRYLAVTGLVGIGLTLVCAALAVPIGTALDVENTTAILLAAAAIVPALVGPVTAGLAQGLERFKLYAAGQVLVPVLRLTMLLLAVALGLGIAGAMAANAAALALGVGLFIWLLRTWAHRPDKSQTEFPRDRMLLASVIGILALTSLTTIDVLVAKSSLAEEDAGLYAAASLVGRVLLFLPAAVVTVLLPRVASRVARGQETRTVLVASAATTAGICLAATVVLAVVPTIVLRLGFGAEYVDAAPLLWRFGIAMTLFAVLNIAFVYDIARGDWRGSALLAVGAVLQLALFLMFHSSATMLVTVDMVIAAVLVLGMVVITRTMPGTATPLMPRSTAHARPSGAPLGGS
jgi:O-antigen/teichoic acid export membrane protein